ncbi:general substrate transporter [Aspergillus ambiguus]|uniref:putative MFS sugar transporter protein n=1 Tax=Aspergillus ambiguus TaxID=176160 RepID=UPI003CCDE177
MARDDPLPMKTAEHVEEQVLANLTEEDLWKMSREALDVRSWTGFRLCLILFVQGCNQAGYGIDWAVISGINTYKSWHSYFDVGSSGGTYGIIAALMQIGMVCGSPFLSLADVIGRRGINFAGNLLVIAASILQGCSTNLKMFMAGRFLMGFGSALLSSSQYIGEVAPVHLRGLMVGIFGACFQVGSLCMTAAMIGLSRMDGDWNWRAPLWLEALFPAIVCATIYLITPESPRYYVKRGKLDKARQVVAKYHTTTGDVNQPIVEVVISQIEASIENDRAGYNRFWDYRVFFKRVVHYRLLVLFLYSIFQQWNGGGIITYYLVPALETIGVTGTMEQLGIQLGTTATYFVFTACGALIIDRFRRRHLVFAGLGTMILFETAVTITSWRYTVSPSKAAAALTILWVYLYQTFSALLVATMHNLYPVEILSLALRAKGMGLYGLIQGGAGAVQTYGIGVGIDKLGYKIWVVYIVYNCIQLVLSYFIFPETKGLSLEEIDAVFETPGVAPVKMSLDIQKAKKEMEQANRDSLG